MSSPSVQNHKNNTETDDKNVNKSSSFEYSEKYNKYFLGFSALTAFTAMIYTINKRTKGDLRPSIQKILANPKMAAMDPKLAAYMFAGRAFAIGTGLTVSATVAGVCGMAMYLGVDNMKDFSIALRNLSQKNLPSLHQSGVESGKESDESLDASTMEFIQEVQKDLKENANENQGSAFYHSIRGNVKKGLGF